MSMTKNIIQYKSRPQASKVTKDEEVEAKREKEVYEGQQIKSTHRFAVSESWEPVCTNRYGPLWGS